MSVSKFGVIRLTFDRERVDISLCFYDDSSGIISVPLFVVS